MENKNMAFARVKPNWDNWGLINLNGDYILDPIFKTIYDWKGGIARLEKKASKIDVGGNWTNHLNGEYGFINSSGELITDFSYGYANDFFEDFAAVCKNKKWGFINKQGELVIPHHYDSVLHFNNNLCSVEKNKKWGLLNNQGELVIPHHYDSYLLFKDNLCSVEKNKKWGVIDKNGNWVIKNDFEHISSYSFGLAIATKKSGLLGKEKKFVINKNGDKIVELPNDLSWFEPVSEELILIGTTSGYPGERYYGFMDLKGEIKVKPIFYTSSDNGFYVSEFIEGKLFVETKEGVKGYVTLEGDFVESENVQHKSEEKNLKSNPYFDEVLEYSEGYAVARKGNLWGVINENNNVVIDFKFKKRIWRSKGDIGQYLSGHFPKFSCGLLGIEEERHDNIYAGYIDTNGKTIIDFKFRVIEPFIKQSAAANTR